MFIGGDGNDTLTLGLSGYYDVIEFHAGDDRDEIYNLDGGNQVQIYDYTSAQSIEQVGTSVLLTLSSTDSITFHDVTVGLVQDTACVSWQAPATARSSVAR